MDYGLWSSPADCGLWTTDFSFGLRSTDFGLLLRTTVYGLWSSPADYGLWTADYFGTVFSAFDYLNCMYRVFLSLMILICLLSACNKSERPAAKSDLPVSNSI